MRDEIKELVRMGPPPSEEELIRTQSPVLEKYEQLLSSIEEPVTDEEAKALVCVLPVDNCFGMGWTLLHLIETAPTWPEGADLEGIENEWVQMLKDRAARWRDAGYPARAFYTRAGLPDPKTTQHAKRDGG